MDRTDDGPGAREGDRGRGQCGDGEDFCSGAFEEQNSAVKAAPVAALAAAITARVDLDMSVSFPLKE